MKKKLEILAYQVKLGSARQLIAPVLDGACPAQDFLTDLAKNNAKGFQILDGQMRFLADVPDIVPRDRFKLLDTKRQLYEFKVRSGLRLYCHLADDTIVVLTNGGKKNTKKEQSRDIAAAKTLCDRFHEIIQQGAEINIQLLDA